MNVGTAKRVAAFTGMTACQWTRNYTRIVPARQRSVESLPKVRLPLPL
jgi:hypothetical protein